MSNVSKRRREGSRAKIKSMGDHKEFLNRITKTLYYGQLPSLPCLSLPLTEISCEEWSSPQRGRSLRRLHLDAASGIARQACVSPTALVLALLYLERLRTSRPDYLANVPPNELFLVSLMVGNKFLQDDGEDEEVICSEWAASGGLDLAHLKRLELEFLNAMDWSIFVSDEHFENGLRWLERRVALKQAGLRGFFTYGDLQASGDAAAMAQALRAVGAACAVAALAYIASLVALLAPALVISQACLAPPSQLPQPASNASLASLQHEPLQCCERWLRHRESPPVAWTWSDSAVAYDWLSFEPWWSRTSVLNWLYQSSLINPMQRWLDKVNEYSRLLDRTLRSTIDECPQYESVRHDSDKRRRRCLRQSIDLNKLAALLGSVSDR